MPELGVVDGDNQVTPGQAGVVITGADFFFTAGTVIISPTNNILDAGALTISSFVSWFDTGIVLNLPPGEPFGRYYWFVKDYLGSASLGRYVNVVGTPPPVVGASDAPFDAFLDQVAIYNSAGPTYITSQYSDIYPTFVEQLRGHIVWEMFLPDTDSGVPLPRRLTVNFDNELREPTTPTLSNLFSAEDLSDVRAHAEKVEVNSVDGLERVLAAMDGSITGPDLAQEQSSFVIDSLNDASMDTLIPALKLTTAFPSADVSTVGSGAPPVYPVFGLGRKVPLALVHANFLAASFTIASGGGPNRYHYVYDSTIPATLVLREGYRLVYGIFWATAGAQIAYSLFDGVTLLHATSVVDQNNKSNHPATDLNDVASARWYRRDIPIPSVMWGQTLTHVFLACEQDTPGTYVAFVENVAILDAYGNIVLSIFNENTGTPNYTNVFFEDPSANTSSVTKITRWDFGAFRAPVIVNKALQFAGSGQNGLADGNKFNFTTLTYGCWFKLPSQTSTPCLGGRQFGGGHGWAPYIDAAHHLACKIITSTGTHGGAGTTVVDDNTHRSMALAINDTAKTWALYLGGLPEANGTYTGSFTTTGGVFYNPGAVLSLTTLNGGQASEFWLFDRVLSAGEILYHHHSHLTGREQGLQGYWRCDEGTGTVIADRSANNNVTAAAGHTWVDGPDETTQLFPNVIAELSSDNAVVPRDKWEPIFWVGYCLAAQHEAPRTPDGRLPKITADVDSDEFDHNPAEIAKFVLNDATYGLGRSVNTLAFALAAAQYKSLINPTGYQLDGVLTVQKAAREWLPEILVHGAYIYKDVDADDKIAVDLPNYALGYDGVDDYVACGDIHGFEGTAAMTVECVITPTDISGSTNRRIISKEIVDGSGRQGWALSIVQTTGAVRFSRWLNGTEQSVTSTTIPTNGQDLHAAGTYDGVTMRLYLWGVQEGGDVASSLSLVDHAGPLTIGREAGVNGSYFKGSIDEIRIRQTARSQGNIHAWMRRELDTLDSDLVFYAQCNEINGGGLFDLVSQQWFVLFGGLTHVAGGAFWNDFLDVTGSTLALGDGDVETGWQNAEVVRQTYAETADRTSILEMSGDLDPGFEGEPKYLSNTERAAPEDKGKPAKLLRPLVARWPVLDVECSFQVKQRSYSKKRLEIKAHYSARLIRLGQHPRVYVPNMKIDGERYKVVGIRIDGLDYTLFLRSWNIDAYTYTRGLASSPATLIALTDFGQTLPAAPTGFTTGTDVFNIASNGMVTAQRTLQATAPTTPNVTSLVFIFQDASGVQVKRREETATSGQTKSVIFDNLATGKTFFGRVYARAANNKPPYQDGVSTAIATVTIGSNPGVPASVTNFTLATLPGVIILTWTNPTNLNLASVRIYRKVGSSPSAEGDFLHQIAQAGEGTAAATAWPDTTGVYGTDYYYAIRTKNSHGELSSGYTLPTPTHAVLPKTTTNDRQQFNTTVVTGGSLSPYTRRVLLYTLSPAWPLTPVNAPEVSGTPYASTLFGPWQQSTTLVSAWQFNADAATDRDMGNATMWWW